MTAYLESTVTNTDATHYVDVWQESFDANEIRVLVPMLQVLTRNFHIVEFEEAEFAELLSV